MKRVEKRASREATIFITWMESEHGHVPYGFHRSLLYLWLHGYQTAIEDSANVPKTLVAKYSEGLNKSAEGNYLLGTLIAVEDQIRSLLTATDQET